MSIKKLNNKYLCMIKLLLKCNKTIRSGFILHYNKIVNDIHISAIVIAKNKSLIRIVIIHKIIKNIY